MNRIENKNFLITVKTQNGSIIVFKVNNYQIKEGFVEFVNPKDNLLKIFPSNNVSIEEVRNGQR